MAGTDIDVQRTTPVRLSEDAMQFRNAILRMGANERAVDDALYRFNQSEHRPAFLQLAEACARIRISYRDFPGFMTLVDDPGGGLNFNFRAQIRERDPTKRQQALTDIRNTVQSSLDRYNTIAPAYRVTLDRLNIVGNEILVQTTSHEKRQRATR